MKKILNILLVVHGILAVSCVNRIDDVFDAPASERLNADIEKCRELLIGAENGWIIQYYPSKTLKYGGFSFAAKFESEGRKVSMTSYDVAKLIKDIDESVEGQIEDVSVSQWSMRTTSSAVLSFDTKNAYLHYLSDADIHRNQYEAESEFIFIDGTPERIVFRGVKTGNRVVFTPVETYADADPDDLPIVTAMKKVMAVSEEVRSPEEGFAYFSASDDEASTRLNLDSNFNLFEVEGQETKVPFVFTPEGVSFYESVEIDGNVVDGLSWEDNAFKISGMTLTGHRNDSFMPYEKFLGRYRMGYLVNGEAETRKFEVEISSNPADPGRSFIMTGLTWSCDFSGNEEVPFRLVLAFDPIWGMLTIPYQTVGTYQKSGTDYTISIIPLDNVNSVLFTDGITGVNLKHNAKPGESDFSELIFDIDPNKGGAPNAFRMTYLGLYNGLIRIVGFDNLIKI